MGNKQALRIARARRKEDDMESNTGIIYQHNPHAPRPLIAINDAANRTQKTSVLIRRARLHNLQRYFQHPFFFVCRIARFRIVRVPLRPLLVVSANVTVGLVELVSAKWPMGNSEIPLPLGWVIGQVLTP